MKCIFQFLCLLLAFCASSPGANDNRTTRVLRKADEILLHATVVSNRAVGYAGACPEANWALSVICASKDDPIGHLVALSERCQPAGFAMCLLGVRVLDEKRFASEFASRRKEIEEAKLTVETAIGCFFEKKPLIEVLEEKSWSREWLICDPIPELWETIRVDPITDPIEKKANQALQHNDHSCHELCLRTPRASCGRG